MEYLPLDNSLFDSASGDKTVDVNGFSLSYAMNPCHGLDVHLIFKFEYENDLVVN